MLGEAIGWLIVGCIQLIVGPILFWVKHYNSLADRDRALTRASYGLMMIAVAWWAQGHRFELEYSFWWNDEYVSDFMVTVALVIIGICGVIWLVTGGVRSRGYRDMYLISRAIAKVGVGLAIYGYRPEASRLIMKIPYSNYADPYYKYAIEFIVMWMVMTGMVKLLLLAIPAPNIRMPVKVDLPDANFDPGHGLR